MLLQLSAAAGRPALPHVRPTCFTQRWTLINWRPTTVVTVDVQLQNFLSPVFGTKFQREVALYLEIPQFPSDTVWEPSEASTPETSSMRSELGLVTDRQTDTQS